MLVPKWMVNSILDRLGELERRVKRLELMELESAKNKIASLSDERAGSVSKTGILTVEEIINQRGNGRT